MTPIHSPRRRLAGRWLVRRMAMAAAGLAVAAACLDAAPARAGTYAMYACNVPGTETGTRGPWELEPNSGASASNLVGYDACASGGSFGLQLPSGTMSPNSMGSVNLFPPGGGISVTGVKAWFTGHLTGSGSPANTLIWTDGTNTAGWGAPGPSFTATPYVSSALPRSAFQLSTFCGNLAGQACQLAAYPLVISGIQTTLSESTLPSAAIAGGTLVSPGARSGTHTLLATASDGQSGVQKLDVLLDDKVFAAVDYNRDWSRPHGEQKAGTCRFAGWNACPATQSHEFTINTRFVPDGAYTLTLRATDAAANVRTVSQALTVDNVPDPAPPAAPAPAPSGTQGSPGHEGPPGPAGPSGSGGPVLHTNGVNGSPAASIRAAFTGRARRAIRTPHGRRVVITGRLMAPGGAAVTGARIHVLHRDRLPGSAMVASGEVVTDGDGAFRYVTTAARSRTIRFGYRAHLGDAAFAQAADVDVSVMARVSLKRSARSLRNGQVVRFSGGVAGAPSHVRKVVELQVRKGSRWMTFRTTRLRNGAFSERYRFTNTRSRQTYVFRARVRQETGFPFATGVSKPVAVTVHG